MKIFYEGFIGHHYSLKTPDHLLEDEDDYLNGSLSSDFSVDGIVDLNYELPQMDTSCFVDLTFKNCLISRHFR